MDGWYHHRSAPVGVLMAGAFALLAALVASVVFYVHVVRTARGLPEYTAGIPDALLAHPAPSRAVYRVRLHGPEGRTTPAGTPSVAHRWRVSTPSAPDDALCAGAASEGVIAVDSSGKRPTEVALRDALYEPSAALPVPPRLLAVCPEAASVPEPRDLEYYEEVVRPGTAAEVVACARGEGSTSVLVPCDDGAPSPVYRRADAARARAEARGAVARVSTSLGAFAAACFGAGLLALRAFDRARSAPR